MVIAMFARIKINLWFSQLIGAATLFLLCTPKAIAVSFLLSVFALPPDHLFFRNSLQTLDLSDFTSLKHVQTFEVTAVPPEGASPVQDEYSVSTAPDINSEPIAPAGLKFFYKHGMKSAFKDSNEPEESSAPTKNVSPKPNNFLKRLTMGKSKNQPKGTPKEETETSKPLPACQLALNSHGTLQNRILTGGSDFTVSQIPGGRDQNPVINHRENDEPAGFSTSINPGLIADGAVRLFQQLENREFISSSGQFNWTKGFGLQTELNKLSKSWNNSLYDNLLGVDCRWNIHAIIGKTADATQMTLLGFVFSLPETNQAFFVQVFTGTATPQPNLPTVPSEPIGPPIPPKEKVPPITPRLETNEELWSDDPLIDDPTFSEDDQTSSSEPFPVYFEGRFINDRRRSTTSGSQSGSFNQRVTPIHFGSHSEGYFSGGTSVQTPTPPTFIIRNEVHGRPDYCNVQFQPLPALPQPPNIPEPLDLRKTPNDKLTETINTFISEVKVPYEKRRQAYERDLKDHQRQLEAYSGPLKQQLKEQWQKAYNEALLDKFQKLPSSCREENQQGSNEPNRSDFDPEGGSGGRFSGIGLEAVISHLR